MSNPERLVFERVGITEEICVTPHTEEMDAPRVVGVPRERDIALVLSKVSDAWFSRFMDELQRICVPRALVVSKVAERVELLADVAGGDCDPGFGVDAEDSMRLLELRNAIDAIGWRSVADEEKGDYLGRLKEIREELATKVATGSPWPQCPICRGSGNTGYLTTSIGSVADAVITCYACDGSGKGTVSLDQIAQALAHLDDDWFVSFLTIFSEASPNRAVAVARISAHAQLRMTAPVELKPDVDLERFGVEPQDSIRLLRLREAIDSHLGKGGGDDHVARIRESAKRTASLIDSNKRQRKELRRLNRAERERSLAVSLAHHQYATFVDPEAERRRIAQLVWSVAQLLEKRPANFTEEMRSSIGAALGELRRWFP